MFCIYKHNNDTYEFDAVSKADELRKVRAWAKENGWKFEEIKKEQTP